MGRVPGNNRVRPVAHQDRRAGLAVAGAVARLQAGDAPGLGQLPAERTCPAAACQQARGLGPAAGAAELLGPGDDQSLIGSQLEDAGQLGLAVGLAAELAVHGRTFFMQRPFIGPGGDQTVEIPEGLGPAPGRGAFAGAVSLEVQNLLSRAQPLRLLVIGRGLVELVGRGPRAGPARVQEPVIGPGGDQAVEVPDRREGVAVLLGLADHRLVPGGTVVELHGRGIEAAELLEPLAPGRTVEPRDRQARLHPQAGPGLDSQRQVVEARVLERLGNGPGAGFAELVDGGDRPAIGREYDLMNSDVSWTAAGRPAATWPGRRAGPRRPRIPRRPDRHRRETPHRWPATRRSGAWREPRRSSASRSLTVPSLPSVRNSRPSGRNPPAASSIIRSPIGCPRVVSHRRVKRMPVLLASRARPSGRNSIRLIAFRPGQ